LDAVCELVRNGTLPSIDAAKSYALFIFIGGVETTERTLTNVVATCMRDPGIWSMMRNNRELVAPVIVETLRLDPPVHALSRGVSRPTELSGVKLAPGDRVLVALGAANRDPKVFVNPEEFDPVRFLGRETREFTPASEIVSFGAGVHHCTGSRLSRLEMEVALNALLDEVSGFESPTGETPEARGYVLRAPETLHAVILRD
jgi:cytochrome P450